MQEIYGIFRRETRKPYFGKANDLSVRPEVHLSLRDPDCKGIHDAIKAHGREAFDVWTWEFPNATEKELYAIEKIFIREFDSYHNGYNLNEGGDGFTSESATELANRRVKEGTHNFLDGDATRERELRKVEEGTHHFLSGEISRESNRRRIEDGTHHFLGGEIQRQRVEDGTHHWLGENNPVHQRIKDGTHHLLAKNRSYATIRNNAISTVLTKTKYLIVYKHLVLLPKTYWEWLDDINRRRKASRESPSDIPDMTDATQLSLF